MVRRRTLAKYFERPSPAQIGAGQPDRGVGGIVDDDRHRLRPRPVAMSSGPLAPTSRTGRHRRPHLIDRINRTADDVLIVTPTRRGRRARCVMHMRRVHRPGVEPLHLYLHRRRTPSVRHPAHHRASSDYVPKCSPTGQSHEHPLGDLIGCGSDGRGSQATHDEGRRHDQ